MQEEICWEGSREAFVCLRKGANVALTLRFLLECDCDARSWRSHAVIVREKDLSVASS